MAYSRGADAKAFNDPMVVCAYVQNSAAETNVKIPVPWNDVKCTYIYSVVETAIDGTGNMEVDFEFNAAGGTEFATLTVAASAAVGTVTEGTITNSTTAALFTEKSFINVEIDGSSTGTGALNLYFYFEPIL